MLKENKCELKIIATNPMFSFYIFLDFFWIRHSVWRFCTKFNFKSNTKTFAGWISNQCFKDQRLNKLYEAGYCICLIEPKWPTTAMRIKFLTKNITAILGISCT